MARFGDGLAVDAELFRLEAVVRWLDAAEGRIKRASEEPVDGRPIPLPRTPRKAVVGP